MNQDKIEYYLKSLQKILDIPIVYGDFGGPLRYYQPFLLSTGENELGFIVDRLQNVFAKFRNSHAMYFIHESLVMLGIVINQETKQFVFVGPIAQQSATERDISDYLFAAGLSADTTQKMAEYMNAVRPLTLDGLQQLLCNINLVLNDEMLTAGDLISIYDSENANKINFANREFESDTERFEQENTFLTESFNNKLNYCVMNGDMDGLAELLNQMGQVPYQETAQTNSLKDFKIVAFGSVFAAETTAAKSGVPAPDLTRIKQFYLGRIDASRSLDDLHQLIISAIFEFTKCVKEHLEQKTDNPAINRAIHYIKVNINSKLLAEDIAGALHINLHYLFTKFKQETGKTLTQFINEEKIKKACYYLMFTDKSLIEISTYLSFSSQSYFQTIFRKVTGQTPTQWRKNNAKL